MEKRIIGFSTGTFFKFLDPITEELIRFVFNLNCEALEISWRYKKLWPKKNSSRIINENQTIQNTTLHLPVDIHYANDNFWSEEILRRAYRLFISYNSFNYAVIHPDLVIDWNDFYQRFNKDFSLPLAIENMGSHKSNFRDTISLLKFFEKYPAIKLIFDTNHWIASDHSITSIPQALETFITNGIQLSGIHLGGIHREPLFKSSSSVEIIQSLRNLSPDIPIIIESIFEKPNEPAIELAFVRKYLEA